MPSWSGTSALWILTSRTKPSVSTEMRRFLPRRKLGAVVAPRFAAHAGSFCGPRVRYCGTGSSSPSERSAQALADGVVHPFPGTVEAPSSEVVVDGLPRWEVTGQQPPPAAALRDVEDSVHDLAEAVDPRSSSPLLWGWEVGFEGLPFAVSKVGGVALAHAPERTRSLRPRASLNSLSRHSGE
jgi:hypothetical protein